MTDENLEIELIAREILKKYDIYGYYYDYIYQVSLKLFEYGIKLYMFWDIDDKLDIWEIVDYVFSNFNVVHIENLLSRCKEDTNSFDCCAKASIIKFKGKKKETNVHSILRRM